MLKLVLSSQSTFSLDYQICKWSMGMQKLLEVILEIGIIQFCLFIITNAIWGDRALYQRSRVSHVNFVVASMLLFDWQMMTSQYMLHRYLFSFSDWQHFLFLFFLTVHFLQYFSLVLYLATKMKIKNVIQNAFLYSFIWNYYVILLAYNHHYERYKLK